MSQCLSDVSCLIYRIGPMDRTHRRVNDNNNYPFIDTFRKGCTARRNARETKKGTDLMLDHKINPFLQNTVDFLFFLWNVIIVNVITIIIICHEILKPSAPAHLHFYNKKKKKEVTSSRPRLEMRRLWKTGRLGCCCCCCWWVFFGGGRGLVGSACLQGRQPS